MAAPTKERQAPHGDHEGFSRETYRTIDPRPFYEAIGRPDLIHRLTPRTPWASWTMEIYKRADTGTEQDGKINGQGGLGMLKGDAVEIARDLGIPLVIVTPFYTKEISQRIETYIEDVTGDRRFRQVIDDNNRTITPEERGFTKVADVSMHADGVPDAQLGVYVKEEGSVTTVTVSEPNLGTLYEDYPDSNHRFYQDVALGFGGHEALKRLGVEPPVHEIEEAAAIISAIKRLDETFSQTHDLDAAIEREQAHNMLTHHTPDPAAEPVYSRWQFDHFVMPNIENVEVRDWLRSMLDKRDGSLRLIEIAFELSGTMNGVSLIHAREASKEYSKQFGKPIEFAAITNGISLERWGNPTLLDLYRRAGVLDEHSLPTQDYAEKLKAVDEGELNAVAEAGRVQLGEVLRDRCVDQYGNPIDIPDHAKILSWNRRFHEYKRPRMAFSDPEKLAKILEENDAYFLLAGKAHVTDTLMQDEMENILQIVDQNPILRKRVKYVQNYREEVGRAIAQGADVVLNTPRVRNPETEQPVNTEACATYWEKVMLNRRAIIVSGEDGGIADPAMQAEEVGIMDFERPYLQITGENFDEEVRSLYAQVERAMHIINGKDNEYPSRMAFTEKQTEAFLPIISGARMQAMYLNAALPQAA